MLSGLSYSSSVCVVLFCMPFLAHHFQLFSLFVSFLCFFLFLFAGGAAERAGIVKDDIIVKVLL